MEIGKNKSEKSMQLALHKKEITLTQAMCPDLAISRKSGAFCPSFAPSFLQIARSAKTKKVALFDFLKFLCSKIKLFLKFLKKEKKSKSKPPLKRQKMQ